jgi:glycosyltransferase involved in cell wall biosynthesis
LCNNHKLYIIVPCFKVKKHIGAVLTEVPDFVDRVILVDDACPEGSGKYVESLLSEGQIPPSLVHKIEVLCHHQNQGVGEAMCTGYKSAYSQDTDIAVKVDSDGQMDLSLFAKILAPTYQRLCRLHKRQSLLLPPRLSPNAPTIRLIGNAGLSFLTKLSSGYWQIMDPIAATPHLG